MLRLAYTLFSSLVLKSIIFLCIFWDLGNSPICLTLLNGQVSSYAIRDVEEYKNFCDRPKDQRPLPEEVLGVSLSSHQNHGLSYLDPYNMKNISAYDFVDFVCYLLLEFAV
jgi:hypothetical protein